MCGKRRYDLLGAKLALATLRNRRRRGVVEKRYYWCAECKAYHLTSREDQR